MAGTPTTEQERAIDQLVSRLDNLEVLPDPDVAEHLVFAGDSADGLTVGHIAPDGSISYITQ